jgi:HEAT repeat protein
MRVFLPLLAFFLVAAPCARATDSPDAAERLRQTLLYGIDSQVLDVIRGLQSSHDSGYTKELARILSEQRSVEVQKAVLALFLDQKVKDGEASAKTVLSGWQDAQQDLLISCIQYLAAISASGLPAVLAPLVDSGDNTIAVTTIQALGKVGDASSVALLLGKLKSTEYPDARKSEIVLALGARKDPTAVDALVAIAKNTDEDKVRRMYAADALGKIGDARAVPVLKAMFGEKDALIRLYAASALAQFSLDEAMPFLVQGLRDENWKLREQSAKALGRQLSPGQTGAVVPVLIYKSCYDPVSQVRVASVQALGAIGGGEAMRALAELYAGSDRSLDSREAALVVLVDKDLSMSLGPIRKVLGEEAGSFDQRTLESTAKVLSTAKGAELREFYVKFLESKDPVVRSYGARGIAANHLSDLRDKLKAMSEGDPNPGTRREAQIALGKL